MKGEVDYLPSDNGGGSIIKNGRMKLIPASRVGPSPDINGVMPNTNLSKVSWLSQLVLNIRRPFAEIFTDSFEPSFAVEVFVIGTFFS